MKDPNGVKGNSGEQAGTISAIQVIKGATKAVIVEQGELFGEKPEVFRDETGSPGGHGVQGFAGKQEITEQDTEDCGSWYIPSAAAPRWQVPVEQSRQVELLKEVADHRRAANLKGFMTNPNRERRDSGSIHGILAATGDCSLARIPE